MMTKRDIVMVLLGLAFGMLLGYWGAIDQAAACVQAHSAYVDKVMSLCLCPF